MHINDALLRFLIATNSKSPIHQEKLVLQKK